MRIFFKIALGFLIITLFALGAAYVSMGTIQDQLQKNIGERSISLATKALESLDKDFHLRIEEFQMLSRDSALHEVVMQSNTEFGKLDDVQSSLRKKDEEWTSAPKDEITPFMQDIISNRASGILRGVEGFLEEKYNSSIAPEIFITNRYGANVAQTGKTSDYNQADEGWWQKAKEKGVSVSDVEYDESAGIFSIPIGIRIDDQYGEFIGVMKVVLNINELTDTLERSIVTSEYRTIQLTLADHDGRVVYDSSREFSFFENLSTTEFFRKKTSGVGYAFKKGEEDEPEDEFFAYAESHAHEDGKGLDFKGLGWVLFVEYGTEEVFAPIQHAKRLVLFTSLVFMLLSILISAYFSLSLSRPIIRLRDAVRKIVEGNLNEGAEVTSGDEIGELAHDFNEMASQLRKSQQELKEYDQNLEKKVKERTSELERFNKMAVGRELRIVQLKKEIATLKLEKGQAGQSQDTADNAPPSKS